MKYLFNFATGAIYYVIITIVIFPTMFLREGLPVILFVFLF